MAKVIITIPNGGGGTVEIPHNELDGLQGIGPDYFHLNQEQINIVDELIEKGSIKEWFAGTYNQNEVVSRKINDQIYLFRSLSNNNTTIPILYKHIEAWTAPLLGGTFQGDWSGFGNSTNIYIYEGFAYYCLTSTMSIPDELTAPDWIKLGQYRGLHDGVTAYNNGDVVTDADDNVYLSQIDFNSLPLDYGIISDWEIISEESFTVYAWGDSLTYGAYNTGEFSYPEILSNLLGWNVVNKGVSGETSTQIKTRFLAAPDTWKYPQIFWVGRNNYTELSIIMDDLAEMISKLPHSNYLVMGIIKANGEGVGPIEALNTAIKNEYQDKFIDTQAFMLTRYSTGFPQDVLDHAAGRIAWSRKSDWLHLNNKGYEDIASIIATKASYLQSKSKINLSDLQTSSVQIIGNDRPLIEGEGGEIFYSDNELHIAAYDRINDVSKGINIGFNTGTLINIGQNQGRIFLASSGGLPTYVSGNAKPLLSLNSTGELLYAPTIGTGKIPYQDITGIFSGSSAYYNGNEFAINTISPEVGFKFQTDGNFALGTQGQARFYGGSLDATTAYLQVRDLSIAQKLRLFTTSLIISDTVPADTGERLQIDGGGKFSGTVKGANATLSNEFMTLGQLPVVLSGSATLDFPNTLPGTSSEMTLTVTGAADGDVVSVGVPNATTTVDTCYTARVSSANTVTIKFNNYSAIAVDPPSGLYKVKVFK